MICVKLVTEKEEKRETNIILIYLQVKKSGKF